jgi:catechol 2,3-dioxygenase
VFFGRKDNHYDLAIRKVSADAEAPKDDQIGLSHLAIGLADEKALRHAYLFLKERGIKIDALEDHGVTHSVYYRDPDDNAIEIYANTTPEQCPEGIRPRVAQINPLNLE